MSRPKNTPMQEALKKEISSTLNQLIESRSISQTDLAEKTGIPKTTINGYIKGTSLPTPGNVEKLAQILNVSKAVIDPRFRTDILERSTNTIEVSSVNVLNIGERIKNARLKRGLTLIEVAEKLGKTEATIQRYESGNIKNLKNDTIEELANILNVSPSHLMGWDSISNPTNLIALSPSTVRIPVLGVIACGDPITAEENLVGYRYESPDNLPSGNLIYLQAKGDSMEPTIPNGSYVLIREQPEVENGEIAAVLVNGDTEATLKRVKKQGETVFLMPDNPRHEPYVITADDPARIIGKAIRYTQDL